jgi:hypothetical protein
VKLDFNDPPEPVADAPALPARRGRGKPRGYPKPAGSGRQKIDPSGDYRTAIARLGKPIELLCALSAGKRVKDRGAWVDPTLDQRVSAARTLLNRIVPELKGLELSGRDGGPIELDVNDGGLSEVARRLAFILGQGRAERMAHVGQVIEQPEAAELAPIEAAAEMASALDRPMPRSLPHRAQATHTSTQQLGIFEGGGRWVVRDESKQPYQWLAVCESKAEALARLNELKGE